MTDHFEMDTDARIRDALQHVRQAEKTLDALNRQEPLNVQAARAQIAHMVTDRDFTLADWGWTSEVVDTGYSEEITVTFTMSRLLAS